MCSPDNGRGARRAPDDHAQGRMPCAPTVTRPGMVERADYDAILTLIPPSSRVLDLGCGDGELLDILRECKDCRVSGLEIDKDLARSAVSRGLSVLEADIDEGLKDFPDNSFDVVVLSQTLQVTRRPHLVLREMLRVGSVAVVSTPNFAHWQVRFQVLFLGSMPRTKMLPHSWYDTPNIHMVTVRDFRNFCRNEGINIENEIFLGLGRRKVLFWPNLFARTAIFSIRKSGS